MNALRAFALIYSEGGIRPAARLLGVSHSSVSRHLRELEAWIGTDLTDRETGHRTLTFTAQGVRLADTARKTLSELHQVTENLRERRANNSVLVDTTPSFAARWLLPRLPDFEDTAPWVKVSVLVDQRQRHPDMMGCDLSIRMGAGPWEDRLAAPLMSDHLVPVASPRYWSLHPKPETSDNLRVHRLLHDRDPNTSWQRWRDMYGPADLDVRKGQRFGSSDLVIRAAEQGLGIALAHHRLIEDSLKSGVLERVFEALSIDLSDAYWIIPAQAKPSKAATAFLDWLRSSAARS
ncbi:LysR substrate-binding domain-containing protein [uncultured Roseovarius sp.]|uniref:LysR substrate-binding domain-containing protein n=1 Tax=uncultured Roseovarius sp. TaxID=293344 RepID=UPI00261A8962|nr:LysR substrate-binding domain-containing protein [uncultured Roseovarius sp.]